MTKRIVFRHCSLEDKEFDCIPCNPDDFSNIEPELRGTLAVTINGITVNVPISYKTAKELLSATTHGNKEE